MEPISMPSSMENPSTKWQNKPVSKAVVTTPRELNIIASLATGRAMFQLVPKPP